MRESSKSVRIGIVGVRRSRRLAEYLFLLYAKAEGCSEAEMARDIYGIDPVAEPARARKIVRSRLKSAKRLANNPELLLAEKPSGHHGRQRNKTR